MTDEEIRKAIETAHPAAGYIYQRDVAIFRLGWEARGKRDAAGTNYIANDAVLPTYIEFANGRTVWLLPDVMILAVGWKGEHRWVPENKTVPWPHCCLCGIIQRHDGLNNDCKGPTKLRAIERGR